MKRKVRVSKQPKSVEEVLTEFEKRKPDLDVCCKKNKSLIEECLEDAEIRFQSIQTRVKSSEKLKEKYSNPKKGYKSLDDITDLAGVRIITYYDDEINAVAEVIKREFNIDAANSNFERVADPERFGYDAINLVCRPAAKRAKQVEYRKIKDIKFEIQITSILGHAWAEMNHDWYDLKDSYPLEIKRRFSRMRALLEVAESEFVTLRKTRSDYQKSLGVRIEAGISGIPIDVVSLKSFVEQDPSVLKVDSLIASIRGKTLGNGSDRVFDIIDERLEYAEIKTFEELVEKLKKFEKEIVNFAKLTQAFVTKPGNLQIPRGVSLAYLPVVLVAEHGGSAATLAFFKKMRLDKWIMNDIHLSIGEIFKKK